MKKFFTKLQFFQIFVYLKRIRKIQLVGLLMITSLSALLEVISLAAVIPFINTITNSNSNSYIEFNLFERIIKYLVNYNDEYFVLATTLIFCLIIIITAMVRVFCIWFSLRYSTYVISDLAYLAYNNSLRAPYIDQINRNSNNVINTLRTEADRSVNVIYGYLNVFTGIVISTSIIFIMLFITKGATIIAAISFMISYFLMAKFSKARLLRNSKNLTYKSEKVTQIVSESIGSIRDIILENNYALFFDNFKKSDISMRISIANNMFFTAFPRYALEGIGILIIALIACYLVIFDDSKENIIGILGVIALGSQRLLPSFQLVYNGWSSIKSYTTSFNSLLAILRTKNLNLIRFDDENKIQFNNKIELKNLYFSYPPKDENVIQDLNLSFKKGERIGILGETGSGKSTLLDILTGLIRPDAGSFCVDDIDLLSSDKESNINNFQKLISYVPQSSYLLDGSFKSNIAFGLKENEIEMEKVKQSAKVANIHSFIEKTKYSYETYVGERGVLISGGQIQRIAIARAIYKGKKILILDEATSALDNMTEKLIMKNIYQSNKEITIIIIAHRLNTLYNCDKLYIMKNKKLERINQEELEFKK